MGKSCKRSEVFEFVIEQPQTAALAEKEPKLENSEVITAEQLQIRVERQKCSSIAAQNQGRADSRIRRVGAARSWRSNLDRDVK
ncbi:hypothetical protein CDL15_Pgr028633 [Punica granatum]|uniref:Uncharacterized protein n=1 Tax=Punica granatum TaxID=22663 RepID=A0A218VWY4_PUNGR|nr:hypothetical protein CDL15_Pgr028633 [Punica granatum]